VWTAKTCPECGARLFLIYDTGRYVLPKHEPKVAADE
jgi:uncharacterized Zn finger protein (UPF0148 family)